MAPNLSCSELPVRPILPAEILQPGRQTLVAYPPGANQSTVLAAVLSNFLQQGHAPESLVVLSGNDRDPTDVRSAAATNVDTAAGVSAETLFGFFLRLLREQQEFPTWKNDFTLMRQRDALTCIARLGESMRFLRRGDGPTLAPPLLKILTHLRLTPATPFLAKPSNDYGVFEGREQSILELAERFAVAKRVQGFLDNVDVLVRIGELGRHPAARARLARIRFVVVRHLEAVPAQQLHALREIVGTDIALFAACDDGQQVERFQFPRAATPLEFAKRFGGMTLVPLKFNRNGAFTEWATRLNLSVIPEPVSQVRAAPFARPTERPVPRLPPPPCVPDGVDGVPRPTLHVAATTRTLVRLVVGQVLKLQAKGDVPVAEQMVLVEADGYADALRDTFADHGVSTRTIGLLNAEDTLVLRWVVCHLQIVAQHRHHPAWMTALKLRGFSETASQHLARLAVSATDIEAATAATGDYAAVHLINLYEKVLRVNETLRTAARLPDPLRQFDKVVGDLMPVLERRKFPRFNDRVAELHALRDEARRYRTLAAFVEYLSSDTLALTVPSPGPDGTAPAPLLLTTPGWARSLRARHVHFVGHTVRALIDRRPDAAPAWRALAAAAGCATDGLTIYAVGNGRGDPDVQAAKQWFDVRASFTDSWGWQFQSIDPPNSLPGARKTLESSVEH